MHFILYYYNIFDTFETSKIMNINSVSYIIFTLLKQAKNENVFGKMILRSRLHCPISYGNFAQGPLKRQEKAVHTRLEVHVTILNSPPLKAFLNAKPSNLLESSAV